MPIPLFDKLVSAFGGPYADANRVEVDASGFNGNLSTTDTDVQAIAQKLNDLNIGANPLRTVNEYTTDGTQNIGTDLAATVNILSATTTGFDLLTGTTLTNNSLFVISKQGSSQSEFDVSATPFQIVNSNVDNQAYNIFGGSTVIFYVNGNNIYPISSIGNGDASGDHPVVLTRDTPTINDLNALALASLNDNSGIWILSSNQITTSDDNIDNTVMIRALDSGILDAFGNEISTTAVQKNTVKLALGTLVRVLSSTDLRVVDGPRSTMGVMRYPAVPFEGAIIIQDNQGTYNSYQGRTAENGANQANQYLQLPDLHVNERNSWVRPGDVFLVRNTGIGTGNNRPSLRVDNTGDQIAGVGSIYRADPGMTIAVQAPAIGIRTWQIFPIMQNSDGSSSPDTQVVDQYWFIDDNGKVATNNGVNLNYKQVLQDGNVRDHIASSVYTNNPIGLVFQHRDVQDDIAWIEFWSTHNNNVPLLGSTVAEIVENVPNALQWIEDNITTPYNFDLSDPTVLESIDYITFISGTTIKVGWANPLPAHIAVNDVITISGNSFAANNGNWAIDTIYSDRRAINISIPGASVANNNSNSGTLSRAIYAQAVLIADDIRHVNINLYSNSARTDLITNILSEWFDITTEPAPQGSLLNIGYNTDILTTGSEISVQDEAGDRFSIKGGPRGNIVHFDNTGAEYQNTRLLPVNFETIHIATLGICNFYIPEHPAQLPVGENRQYTIHSVPTNDDDDCIINVGLPGDTIVSSTGLERVTVLNGTRLMIELFNNGNESGWHIVSPFSRSLAQETRLQTEVAMNSADANPLPIDVNNILVSQNEDANFDFFDLNTNENEITLKADFNVEAQVSLRFFRNGGPTPTGSLTALFQIMPLVNSGLGFVDQDRFAIPVEVDFNSEVGSIARINFRWLGSEGDRIKFEPRVISLPQGYTQANINVADWRISNLTAKSKGV